MKRCPQCNRVETDDALVFCRADGTALISDSGSVGTEAGTVKFGSGAVSSEIEEKDKAFVWLEKDVAERTPRPPVFSVNPVWDDLRDDPRFQDLLRRIELAKTD